MGLAERVVDSGYRRVGASVRAIAGQDAPDCVQEAYARAIASGVSIDAEPWLKTVAKRVAIDKVRRRHEFASGAPVELEGMIRDHDGDPQEAFVRAERSAEVRKALAELPDRYREALITYAEEDSPAAVASKLGLSANAAWTLLSRARSRLRLQLEHVGYAPVAWLGRVRWRGFAVGGAAAATAAAVAMSPLVPHHANVQPKQKPAAIVQTVDKAKNKTSHGSGPVPKVKLPDLPIAAPKVGLPSVPPTPETKELASACVGLPNVGKVVGVKVDVSKQSLLGTLTGALKKPVDVGSKLCK